MTKYHLLCHENAEMSYEGITLKERICEKYDANVKTVFNVCMYEICICVCFCKIMSHSFLIDRR